MRVVRLVGFVLVSFVVALHAQDSSPRWKDPSTHSTRFVRVDKNVKLEVLDWHGSGRPMILLAGGGFSAHVFDDFAPKLVALARLRDQPARIRGIWLFTDGQSG